MNKLKLFALLGLMNKAYAFAANFKCTNCNQEVLVPMGASNTYWPDSFFYIIFAIIVISIITSIINAIRKKNSFVYAVAYTTILVIFFIPFLIVKYTDYVELSDFAKSYGKNYNVQNINVMGKYLFDEKNNTYILCSDDKYYLIDFEKETATQIK